MIRIPFVARLRHLALLALPLIAGACDVPLAPEDAPTVVVGRVASVLSLAPAAIGPTLSNSGSLAGIEVRVEGASVMDLTDDAGDFRLEVRAQDGRIRIRFRRGSMDVRLELEGLASGSTLRLEVSLSDDGATVLSASDDEGPDEFEGIATLVSVDGDAPNRTLRVELVNNGGSVLVDLVEASTVLAAAGDITTFAGVQPALERADLRVKIEGDGERQDDGSVIATLVKVETDGDDDQPDDDEGPDEFEGIATLVSVDGDAPNRTLRVELVNDFGSVLVDLVEASTVFDAEGDITSFAGVQPALERADLRVKIEGDGERQDDGSVIATLVKVETDG